MKNIHVGNLSVEATEASVGEAFTSFGAVQGVSIIRDRQTGVSRGFGFVQMESSDQADAAIVGLNGTQLDGSTLAVTEARSRGVNNSFGTKPENAAAKPVTCAKKPDQEEELNAHND